MRYSSVHVINYFIVDMLISNKLSFVIVSLTRKRKYGKTKNNILPTFQSLVVCLPSFFSYFYRLLFQSNLYFSMSHQQAMDASNCNCGCTERTKEKWNWREKLTFESLVSCSCFAARTAKTHAENTGNGAPSE